MFERAEQDLIRERIAHLFLHDASERTRAEHRVVAFRCQPARAAGVSAMATWRSRSGIHLRSLHSRLGPEEREWRGSGPRPARISVSPLSILYGESGWETIGALHIRDALVSDCRTPLLYRAGRPLQTHGRSTISETRHDDQRRGIGGPCQGNCRGPLPPPPPQRNLATFNSLRRVLMGRSRGVPP